MPLCTSDQHPQCAALAPQLPEQQVLVPHWLTPGHYDCRMDEVLGRFVCPIKRGVVVDPVITVYGQVSVLLKANVVLASRIQFNLRAFGMTDVSCPQLRVVE